MDYSIYLKSRSFENIHSIQYRLLWIFLSLKCHPYVYAVLLSLMQQHWLNKHFPQLSQILQESIHSFNEESGEVALSVLARSVLGSSSRLNADKVRENFVLAHKFRQISRDFKDDWGVTTRRRQLRIDAAGKEVELLSEHFGEVIQNMADGKWKHFGPNNTKLHKSSDQVMYSDDRALQLNMADELEKYYGKMVKNLFQNNKSHLEFQEKFRSAH